MRSSAIALGMLLVALSCSRRQKPPADIEARYRADAERMCVSLVQCLKDDVARNMAAQPERRDMVLRRMTREMCVKHQFRLIGDTSVRSGLLAPDLPYSKKLYDLYADCSRAVAAAPVCSERRRLHREAPSCRSLRQLVAAGNG